MVIEGSLPQDCLFRVQSVESGLFSCASDAENQGGRWNVGRRRIRQAKRTDGIGIRIQKGVAALVRNSAIGLGLLIR